MAINLNQITSDQVIELASSLDRKSLFRVLRGLLPILDSGQLEELQEAVGQTLAEAILDEEAAIETQAKFEYKRLPPNSNNFYAYIRKWGREDCEPWIYLGRMRFMPGMKYQLTHKKDGTVKTLAGLGLYRNGEQIYLEIQHLTPVYEIKSYPFYDRTQEFPRRAREDSIDILFSPKVWSIDCLGTVEAEPTTETSASVAPDSTPRPEKPATMAEVVQQPHKAVNPAPVSPTDKPQPRKNTILAVKRVGATQAEAPPTNPKQQLVVQVQRNFIAQVQTYLRQWEAFSQAIPSNPQCKLVQDANGFRLCNEAKVIVVEYSSSSGTLRTQSARLLLSWLEEIVFSVANSSLVNQKQRALAARWLKRLQLAPKKDDSELLKYLFSI